MDLPKSVANEERRFRRLKASGDLKRLKRLRDVRLPALSREIEKFNECHEVARSLLCAEVAARLLQALVKRQRPYFRKSYRYEAYLERLL